MNQLSKTLFYVIAAWCIVVGSFNQTISNVDDLPWVAAALEGSDVAAFNPILAIWAHWVGMYLITAGIGLALIVSKVPGSPWSLSIASILAIGTVGAQSYSVLSLGAFGPISYILLLVPSIAVLAAVTGFLSMKSHPADS